LSQECTRGCLWAETNSALARAIPLRRFTTGFTTGFSIQMPPTQAGLVRHLPKGRDLPPFCETVLAGVAAGGTFLYKETEIEKGWGWVNRLEEEREGTLWRGEMKVGG